MARQRYSAAWPAIETTCASLPTQSPSHPRTPARKAGVLHVRERLGPRDRLSAGGGRIRTTGSAKRSNPGQRRLFSSKLSRRRRRRRSARAQPDAFRNNRSLIVGSTNGSNRAQPASWWTRFRIVGQSAIARRYPESARRLMWIRIERRARSPS
jgi:hypothetical protein